MTIFFKVSRDRPLLNVHCKNTKDESTASGERGNEINSEQTILIKHT